MKILITGANGYIGRRLLPVLLEQGHEVVATVRDRQRFDASVLKAKRLEVVEVDFLKDEQKPSLPEDIDVAYFLIHSMSSGQKDFNVQESDAARNFVNMVNRTNARQIITAGDLGNNIKFLTDFDDSIKMTRNNYEDMVRKLYSAAVANQIWQVAAYDMKADLKVFVRIERDYALAGYRYLDKGKTVYNLARLNPGDQIGDESWQKNDTLPDDAWHFAENAPEKEV